MKKSLIAASLLCVLSTPWITPAFAAVRTVTLSVPDMYCATCPITVRKALEKVAGVSKVSTSLESKQAVVTFDDTKTTINALEDATFEAGYASTAQPEKRQ